MSNSSAPATAVTEAWLDKCAAVEEAARAATAEMTRFGSHSGVSDLPLHYADLMAEPDVEFDPARAAARVG